MAKASSASELMLRWQELRDRGQVVSAEELCADCPELLDEVRRQIEVRLSVEPVTGATVSDGPGTTPAGTPASMAGAETLTVRRLGPDADAADGGAPLVGSRYRPLRLHAQGGLGDVFLARDEELSREVALKRMRGPRAADPASRRRFLREGEITGGLEHPGVVPVYGLSSDAGGEPSYAMRFVRGQTLREAIARFQAMPQADRGLALRQLLGRFVVVCNTMAYAHSRGVVHRDLKPANIMLGDYGETLVVDWGLAKRLDMPVEAQPAGTDALAEVAVDGRDDATATGELLGTPAFMSPEQAAGRHDAVGPASDIYSLGATLYAVLTGRPPCTGNSVAEIVQLVRRGAIPRPRQLRPDTPRALEAICLKAMAREPAARYATALELAADVERWLADEPVAAYREPRSQRLRRWARRHRPLVAAMAATAVVALLLAGGGAWWLDRQRTHLRQAVETDLTEAARLKGQARWAEARTALVRGEGRLGAGGPEDLRQQVGRLSRDLDVVARLDELWLKGATLVAGGKFDAAGADRAYAALFAEAGLGAVGDDAEVVAGRIRASGMRAVFVASLDDWAVGTDDDARLAWLLDVARRADPDPWRDRARSPAVWRDRSALERLASEEAASEQSPQLVSALAMHLESAGASATGLLRRAQARHPGDLWLNLALGRAFQESAPAEAVAYYRAALALRPGTVAIINDLGFALRGQGRLEEAQEEFQRASQLDHRMALPHHGLGLVRARQGRREEAKAEFHKAIQLDAEEALPHNGLAAVYYTEGRLEEAKAECRKAIQFDPKFALPHHNLGNILADQGRPKQAEEEFSEAIQLDPKDPLPHHGMGRVLADLGRPKEAQAQYRRAIELDPKFALGHVGLGHLLRDSGRLAEARTEFVTAIRLEADLAQAHHGLGLVLNEQESPKQAEAEFRKAIQLDPMDAWPVNGLGLALYHQDRLDEALAEFRKAIHLDRKFPLPHHNMANVLADQGRLSAAEAEFRQALTLGDKGAQTHLRLCQERLALARRLPTVIKGQQKPAGAAERLAFAELCTQAYEKRYVAAARFYEEAFGEDARLADDLEAEHRYSAACAAALAGCGQGKDDAGLDPQAKARLRGQAIAWLRADLALRTKQARSAKDQDRSAVQQALRQWQEDADLACVRDPVLLAKLPAAERQAWHQLWDDVAVLRQRAGPASRAGAP